MSNPVSRLVRKVFPKRAPPPRLYLEPAAEDLLRETIGRSHGGVFVDLGANVGNVTAVALDCGYKVVAFEPDPFAVKILRQRFAENPRVEIIPKAVGASARAATFYQRLDRDTIWSSLVFNEVHEGGKRYTVDVVDVTAFILSLGQPIGVMKMDIEGAEVECLNAILEAGLHRSIGLILVETHERFSGELAVQIEKIRCRISDENIQNIRLDWV